MTCLSGFETVSYRFSSKLVIQLEIVLLENSLEIRKNVKSLSEYGEIVKMPKEISTLRKQSELSSQEDANENEASSLASNGARNNEPQQEIVTIETLQEEYEQEA